MQLTDSILIRRAPDVVWDFLQDPENMQLWNPRVEKVTPSGFGDFRTGYRYAITYRMHANSRATTYQAEFKVFEPPRKLAISLVAQPAMKSAPEILEQYELTPQADGTLLTQTILIEKPGIPVIFRVLIWLIRKFGKPVGKPFLAELRDLVEGIRQPA